MLNIFPRIKFKITRMFALSRLSQSERIERVFQGFQLPVKFALALNLKFKQPCTILCIFIFPSVNQSLKVFQHDRSSLLFSFLGSWKILLNLFVLAILSIKAYKVFRQKPKPNVELSNSRLKNTQFPKINKSQRSLLSKEEKKIC